MRRWGLSWWSFSVVLVATAGGCELILPPDPNKLGGAGSGAGAQGGGGTGAQGGTTGGAQGGSSTGTVPITCGNSKMDDGEECDDGNADNADTCTNACKKPVCGDGFTQPANSEECDDGNADNTDSCTNTCKKTLCGDGVVQPGSKEECDKGKDNSDIGACTASCQNARCGDGLLYKATEECDDSNQSSDDGCSASCQVEAGWTCEVGAGCKSICGDGIATLKEACDDGNTGSGDGCDMNCKLESVCGNGTVEAGEVCDGGADCTVNCTSINANKSCGKAVSITASAPDASGVALTKFKGDTAFSSVPPGEVLDPTCQTAHAPSLYSYVTGKRGSIVNVEVKSDGDGSFTNSVLWVYRDCLGKTGEEICNDDIDAANQKLFSAGTTGYLPPLTALFIVVDGVSLAQKGKFELDITEQPVTLLTGATFSVDLGSFSPGGGGESWKLCNGGACGANPTGAWSGRGYAVARDGAGLDFKSATLQSPQLGVGKLSHVFVQYDLAFSQKGGGNPETFTAQYSPAGAGFKDLQSTAITGVARRLDDIAGKLGGADSFSLQFVYDDAGGDGDFAAVDDVWVYGY